MIHKGHSAPEFNLPDQDGKTHSLKAHQGHPIVLYFYPKDDTPGCTTEACEFRDLLPKFEKVDAVVLGVSPDDEASHGKFAGKFSLLFPLLADVPDDSGLPPTCSAYGVWQEKMNFGRTYMGVVRTTYLIDGDGVVAKRWDKVKVDGHANDVLAAVQELHAARA